MLIKNFTDDKFIRAYNAFSNTESQFFLNDEEFYMYSLLFVNQMLDGSIRTNIDIINQFTKIKFIQNDTKNKTKIKNLITSLLDKKVLLLENDVPEIKNNSLLELSINDLELSNDGVSEDKKVTKEGKYQNFSKIPYTKFLEFESTRDYYIYYVVSRWSNGFRFSYNDWAELLGFKHQESAIRVIDDVVKRGIIHRNIGEYNSRTNQNPNIYSIFPFNENEKTNQTKKKEQLDNIQKDKEIHEELNEFIDTETRTHNWYEKNSRLTEMDFYIYLTTNDEKLKKQAEFRINAISKNEKGKFIVESLMKEAQEKVKDEKRKQEQERIKQMTNAVRLKNGDIVAVDVENIDSIVVKEVEHIFYSYYGEHLESYIEIQSFQTAKLNGGQFVYDDRPDMIQRGWELYIEHVKTGEMLTSQKGELIRNQVFKEFLPQLKDETETKITYKRKKDESDISSFVKEEKKKKREIIDIASIVVEDWELDEKKRENKQKEYLERESRLLKLLNELN